MKTHDMWGYGFVIPLVSAGWLICYVLYQVGVPLWLVSTFATAAYFYVAIKYDQ